MKALLTLPKAICFKCRPLLGTVKLKALFFGFAGLFCLLLIAPNSAHAQTLPVLSEVTPVPPFGSDPTPSYRFTTSEAGRLSMGGSCGTSSPTSINADGTTITLIHSNTQLGYLPDGRYDDCTIEVTNAAGTSLPLSVTRFVIDRLRPTVKILVPEYGKPNETYLATFQFSEPVASFSAGDVERREGAMGDIEPVGNSYAGRQYGWKYFRQYTAEITPNDPERRPVTLSVRHGAVVGPMRFGVF